MPISGISGVIFAFTYLLSTIIIRPKFDKIFKKTSTPCDPRLPFFSIFWRTANYMLFIVTNINVKRADPKKNLIYKIYRGYDFRGNATFFQILNSYICFIFLFLSITTIYTYWIIDFFIN